MEYLNVERELEEFAKQVVKESKANLKRLNKKASGDLINKMGYNLNTSENSFELGIGWPENKGGKYATFVNYGVKGKESGKSLKGYKYTNKKPPKQMIKTWLKQKRGRFRERSLDSQAFAVQNIIYKRGLKPTEFFSKPFEKAFADLPDDLIEAYGLDLDDFLNFVFNGK